MRPALVGVAVGVGHLAVTFATLIVTLGAAFGSARPWADTLFEDVVIVLTVVLLAPLSALNWALPRHLGPGCPVGGVVLTSALWGAAAYAIARWRQGRSRRGQSPDA